MFARAETIITAFELQVNDITELSTAEELSILNRVQLFVATLLPWECLKKNATGTASLDGSSGLYYIDIPSDFMYFCPNNMYTDNAIGVENNASAVVIFVGSNYTPIQVVNFSDRRQYRTKAGYAYLDLANSKIWFTNLPSNLTTYDFDYVKTPTTIAAGGAPAFPERFDHLWAYAMAVENDILQLSEKAKSYQKENQTKYDQWLTNMKLWNAKLILN